MFTNLIESQSHRKEFKRRSSFFLFTVAAYAVILFGAGIGSIYAYDAQLETQASSLELMSWVPPITPAPPKPVIEHPKPSGDQHLRMRRSIQRPTSRSAPWPRRQQTIRPGFQTGSTQWAFRFRR